jgi:hypothetical protein
VEHDPKAIFEINGLTVGAVAGGSFGSGFCAVAVVKNWRINKTEIKVSGVLMGSSGNFRVCNSRSVGNQCAIRK